MRKDLLGILIALAAVGAVALVLVGLTIAQEGADNSKALAASTEALATATADEAVALHQVATAEAITGRNELAAAGVAGDIELLKTFLPQGDSCVTTTTNEGTTITCNPVIPTVAQVTKAVSDLTGTPEATLVQRGDGTPTVRNQILPIDRLLPDTQGEAWQFLLPITQGDEPGGYWGPATQPTGERHVMTFTPGSPGSLDWAVIGGTGGGGSGTIGDITNIRGGDGISVTDATTHTPTVSWEPSLFTKVNGIEAGAEVNVQSDWDATSGDAFILNKPGASDFLPAYEAGEFLKARDGSVLEWEGINEIPDTPGTATGIGHALVVTGEDDADYNWRAPSQFISLSTGGGLAFNSSGHLHTVPSLIGTAANADASKIITDALPASVPAAQTAATDYALRVPASGRSTWVEITGGSGATDTTARQGVSDNAAAIAENDTKLANLQGGFSTNHGLIVNVGAEVDAVETDVAANRETIDRDATRLAVLHPDGTETELIWLSSETATSLFRVPDVITTANRDTPTASRLVVEGYIPGVSSVSDINRVVFSGQIIRTVSSLGEGEYIDAGLFKIIVGFTNIQAKNLVNSTSNPLRLQISYGSGGLYNVDIPRRASGTALVPYIDPDLIIGGVSSGGGTTDQTARDAAATAQTAAEGAASAAQTAQTKADTNATNIADIGVKLAAAVRVQNHGAGTDREYQSALDAQESANTPIILHVTAAITGTRDGATYTHPANSIFWVPPESDTVIHLFTLPTTTWREITINRGAYPILPTDQEFVVVLKEGSDEIYFNVQLIRPQLSTTTRTILVDTERPDGNASADLGVRATLNSAGTALTLAVQQTDRDQDPYAISEVYAR